MACGLAALDVIDSENLVENSARMGHAIMERLDALRAKHSFIKEVRGKGLMIAIVFHEPTELKLRMAWKLLHKVDKVLFPQMVVTQLLGVIVFSHRLPATEWMSENSTATHDRRTRGRPLCESAR